VEIYEGDDKDRLIGLSKYIKRVLKDTPKYTEEQWKDDTIDYKSRRPSCLAETGSVSLDNGRVWEIMVKSMQEDFYWEQEA